MILQKIRFASLGDEVLLFYDAKENCSLPSQNGTSDL